MRTGTRILLVLGTSAGGTGAHVHALAVGLAGHGFDVTVCGPRSTEAMFGFAGAGTRFRPVEIAGGLRPYADVHAARALRRHLSRPAGPLASAADVAPDTAAGADLVHAHGLRAGLVAALVVPRATPYVVTWHNAAPARGAPGLLAAAAQRLVARRADISLCVSPDLEARVRALGGRDVRPGPVAGARLPAPTRSRADVRQDLHAGNRPIVLSVGRLHPQKGHHTLITAAGRLAGRQPGPLFVIAGDGPQRAELAAEIARTRAPVELLGHRTDIADLLAAADLVVSASDWEGSPLALQEALRAGRPLVATLVGGVASLLGAGALLVPAGDPDALAAAIARVLGDPAYTRSLADAATAAAARLPTPESTLARLEAIYAELLGEVLP